MQFDKAEDMVAATNSIVLAGPDARLHGRYDKAHLVPYGEYLPMRPLLEALGLSRLVPGDIDFIPGPGPRTMSIPGFGKVGMQICYEMIFSGAMVDPADRPDFIFNPSNDAWFGDLGPPAHLAQARLRAIEEGLPIVRSTPDRHLRDHRRRRAHPRVDPAAHEPARSRRRSRRASPRRCSPARQLDGRDRFGAVAADRRLPFGGARR